MATKKPTKRAPVKAPAKKTAVPAPDNLSAVQRAHAEWVNEFRELKYSMVLDGFDIIPEAVSYEVQTEHGKYTAWRAEITIRQISEERRAKFLAAHKISPNAKNNNTDRA